MSRGAAGGRVVSRGAALREVTRRAGGRTLLDRVSLEVPSGELVILIGPNGAGKSTAVAALAGDVSPESGTALLHGRETRSWSMRERGRLRSVLVQGSRVAFPYRVREVVAMGLTPRPGRPDREAAATLIEEALERTGTLAFADRDVTSLSGGEQARVALARMLAQDAPVMLLDEPTDALDIAHQEQVMGILRACAAEGRAVLAVVHDLGLAAAYATRVVALDGGRVIRSGDPATVLTGPILSNLFGHPIEVFPHPASGVPLISPIRAIPPDTL